MPQQNASPDFAPDTTDMNQIAKDIEGILDDDGHFNPNPDQISRGHPDYDPDADPRNNEGGQERDSKGRFAKRQQQEDTDSTDDQTAEDRQSAESDQTEDTDNQDRDTDGDQQAQDGTSTDGDNQDTGDTIQTLADMANALEMPEGDFKQALTHTFNAAGEEVTVTLEELEKGYQKDADYRRSTAKLAEDRQTAESDYASRMQQFDQQSYVMAQQFGQMEQILMADMNSPALQQLRQTDPAEWTARTQELQNRMSQLQNARQQMAQQYANFQAQHFQDLKTRELDALKRARPEYSEADTATSKEVMRSFGYSDAEIGNLYDHRLVLAALEVNSLREQVKVLTEEQAKAADTVKRVKKDVPKMQKGGKTARSAQKPQGIDRGRVQQLRDKAKKSGSVTDAAKVIEQFI